VTKAEKKKRKHIAAVKRMLIIWAVHVKRDPDLATKISLSGRWGKNAQRAMRQATGSNSAFDAKALRKLRRLTRRKRSTRYWLGARRVQIALSQVGVTEHPPNSNSGRQVEEYQHATGLGGTGWPWCVAFVSWVHMRAQGKKWAYRGAGVYDMEHWLSRRKRLKSVYKYKPIAGDIVTYSYGNGHTGLYIRTRGSYIETVEGNTSPQ